MQCEVCIDCSCHARGDVLWIFFVLLAPVRLVTWYRLVMVELVGVLVVVVVVVVTMVIVVVVAVVVVFFIVAAVVLVVSIFTVQGDAVFILRTPRDTWHNSLMYAHISICRHKALGI